MRNRRTIACMVWAATALARSSNSLAVSWNASNPSLSATTTTGLTDKSTLFINENVVNDTANSTRGTGTYLGDGWVLTAQHVLTGSANIYGTLATPGQITMTVSIGGIAQNYTADTLSVNGSADIGLIHLAGTTSGPITMLPGVLKSAIQTNTTENNSLVQLGGYGYYGPLAGTLSMDASFHRAVNVATVSGSFMNVSAVGNSRLVNNNYVMGIGESGDSGSGLWMDTGADSDTNLWDYNLVGALDTTSNGNAFGSNNQYSRVSSNSGWLLSTAYSGRTTVTWDVDSTTTNIQEGSGTWDLSSTNFGNGVNNFAWDNSSTRNAFFGANKGAAGTVTLGANVSVQNMMFNPSLSGTYTIAGGTGFAISLSSNSVIMSNTDSTISAPLAGGGGTVTKLGPAVLTLSGSNTFTGNLSLGNGSTSGGNLNGAVCIASSDALDHITQISWTDNNSSHDVLQLDASGTVSGSVSIPATVAFSWNANNDGPSATAANIIENIAGSNVVHGAITGNTGGIGYGIVVDAGTLTLNSFTSTSTKTLYLRGPGNGSFSGTISGASVGVNQTGTGTWTLNAGNSYSLATTLAAGVLSTTRLTVGLIPSGIGNSSSAAANVVLSGGTLQYLGSATTTNRLFTIGAGGGTLDSSGSGALIFSNTGSTISSDGSTHSSITVAGSNIVTLTAAGFTDLANGMTVTGTGIPAGTTITSVNFDAGTIGLGASATSAGAPTLSFGALARTLTLAGSNAGSNTLNPVLSNSSAGARLGVTKSGSGLWILSAAETYTGPTLVTQGTLTLNSGSSISSATVTVSDSATFNVMGSLNPSTALTSNGLTNFAANTGTAGPVARSLSSIAVGAGGTVVVDPSSLHVNRTVLVSGSTTFSGTISVPLGKIDLYDNDLLMRNVDSSQVEPLLSSGLRATGYWNGQGIESTSAANDSSFLTTLGYMQSDGSLFDGVNTTTGDVLVKYTFYGDANLNGTVDGADYQQIDAGFGSHLTGWSNGDFNYDGAVDGSDFALIDNTFNQITATGASSLARGASATVLSTVPEPGALGLGSVAAVRLIVLRRRGQHSIATAENLI